MCSSVDTCRAVGQYTKELLVAKDSLARRGQSGQLPIFRLDTQGISGNLKAQDEASNVKELRFL